MGPPSLEEAVGGLAEQLAKLVTQRLRQMGVDLRGLQSGMPEQDLDDADVHTPLEHVRGKAVAKRVGSESGVEAALVPRLDERGPCGCVGQVSRQTPTGKEPPCAAVSLPDLAEHLKDRFGQRENTFLVSLPDDAEHHLLRVDCRDGQGDRFCDPQAVGIDERETAAIDGLFQRSDQAAAVLIAADVGQPLLAWLAYFFFVNSGHS